MNASDSLSLALTHLRFEAVARTAIRLGGWQAGERLRNALANVMLRAVCPESEPMQKPSPAHIAACPVCWLLSAEIDPGQVRRAYSLAPPFPSVDVLQRGDTFSFVITLYGVGFQYLPYFVLASPEAGRIGVGPGHGLFDIRSIQALNPLPGLSEGVLAPGENLVRVPQGLTRWQDALAASERLLPTLPGRELALRFLTPTRLIEGDALVKIPDFGVLFRRLLKRLEELSFQFSGQPPRPREETGRLHSLADRVRLINADVKWVELWGPSGRTGRPTPMGGFVGTAAYRSDDWESLLPWLLLGQGTQVGKLAVKGNGVYQVETHGQPGYWERILCQ
jgi:hypothetical protein